MMYFKYLVIYLDVYSQIYCRGVSLLGSRSVLDKRFERLSTALSEAKLTVGTGRVDKSQVGSSNNKKHYDPGRSLRFLPATSHDSRSHPDLMRKQLARAATTLR